MSKLKDILLIEDDRFISELYARTLRKAGYDVDTAITGPEGFEKGKSGKYQLILLDIMIPDLNGIEVLNQLQGENGRGLGNTKVIVTTNLDQDDESRLQLEQRVDGYLIKADVTPKKLLAIIKQVEEFGQFKTV